MHFVFFMFYMFLWNNECVLFFTNNSGYSVANFSDIFMVLYGHIQIGFIFCVMQFAFYFISIFEKLTVYFIVYIYVYGIS